MNIIPNIGTYRYIIQVTLSSPLLSVTLQYVDQNCKNVPFQNREPSTGKNCAQLLYREDTLHPGGILFIRTMGYANAPSSPVSDPGNLAIFHSRLLIMKIVLLKKEPVLQDLRPT